MLHTLTCGNPHFEGDVLHGLVHFHKGTAMVDDALEVIYDTAEGVGDSSALHPVPHNALAQLVAQGYTDLGPLYGEAAQAALGGKGR